MAKGLLTNVKTNIEHCQGSTWTQRGSTPECPRHQQPVFSFYCQNASKVPHGQKEDEPQIAPGTSNQRFDSKSVHINLKPDLSGTSTCMRKAWSTTLLSIQYGRGETCTFTDGIYSFIRLLFLGKCCCYKISHRTFGTRPNGRRNQ